jgi:ribosomal-protein-alanine N-acetyltransferase
LITGKNSFLLGVLTDYEAEILTLAVDPINRRLGIAKNLLKKFENICLQKNINKILLEVAKNNVPAIQLYKSCHYVTKGKRKNYYTSPKGEKIDAIVMVKSI